MRGRSRRRTCSSHCIQARQPAIYAGFAYTYATVWFSTPFLVLSGGFSFLYIFVARWDRPTTSQPLPPYPAPETREDLFLILGERHRQTSPQRASVPTWLTIPERGLYTGMVIVGAIGTGKTSACMYPYVEQLLGYRANDPAAKLGGLILEVKGDFCTHVRDMLARRGRADDYVEISLDVAVPLQPAAQRSRRLRAGLRHRHAHDQSLWPEQGAVLAAGEHEPGQVRDPPAQDARRLRDALSGVRARHQSGQAPAQDRGRGAALRGEEPPRRRRQADVPVGAVLRAWTWHDEAPGDRMWTHWSPDLVEVLGATIPHHDPGPCRRPPTKAHRIAQFEAVKRWFEDDWMRIEPKLRTSIVEGISVFLSLFDDNPQVKHTFCPPKDMYDPAQNPDGVHGVPLAAARGSDRSREGDRAQFPDRDESRAGAGVGHDAEAGLSARRAQSHPPDARRSEPQPASGPVRVR